ncbi:hypothetical protein CEXT_510491 [Caerostris extrusa]|uniref:Uncharacterized protein n=1 Tax=Caerostris extrusa TaxID=172846 RepID=A0AAV4SZ50_CAEEX|nr:hypothetical protein CEXT_510491 [Caerostris extrusa]
MTSMGEKFNSRMDSEEKPAGSEMVSELPEPEVETEDVKAGMLRAAPTRNRFGKTSKAKKHEQTSKEASEENCDEKKDQK